MIQSFVDLYNIINAKIFLLSMLLFFTGYAIAPTAYYKKIKWLTAYPFFIIKLIDKHFKNDWHPLKIFLILFALNSLSLFLNLLSAWGVVLPFLFIIYLGINIGIVMYHSMAGKFYYFSLLNPVAMLELPAAWLSIAMAIQFSLNYFFGISLTENVGFSDYVYFYSIFILPLMALAGIIETALIVFARNKGDESDKEN